MPSKDIMSAFNSSTMQGKDKKRSKAVSDVTAFFAGSPLLNSLPPVPEENIPLELIVPRAINEFSDMNNLQLEESIRSYGLLQPIIVTKEANDTKYTICSGHRRYNAVKKLHEDYPDVERFKTIACCVYEITDDPVRLNSSDRYITKETEEAMYRETNLQARQLSYKDVSAHIEYILNRIDEPNYLEKAKKIVEESTGKRGNGRAKSGINRVDLISSVVAASNYKGWSRETLRMYLVIRDAGRVDLIERIQNGEAVSRVYKEITKKRNRSRDIKTIIKNLSRVIDDITKEVDNGNSLSALDKMQLRTMSDVILKLIDESETADDEE